MEKSKTPGAKSALGAPALHNPFYRPIKKLLTLRLDANVIGWLRKNGKGYETRAKALLRDAMLADLRQQTG